MITPLISLSINDDGSILGIKDITTYADPVRDDVALLIVWSKDAFVADFNLDLTNPNPGEWNEMVANGYTYNVLAFASYIYSNAINVEYGLKAIIYDAGNFYIKTSVAGINYYALDLVPPSEDPANWKLFKEGTTLTFEGGVEETLTAEDIYTLIGVSLGLSEPIASVTAVIEANANSVFLEKLSCHSWRVRNNSTKAISSVNLLKYDDTLLATLIGSDTVLVDIEAYGDGMYIVQIILDNGNNTESMVEYPLVDFCDAYDCYVSLFKHWLCSCSDPCASGSDCDETLQTKLDDMNAIRELISSIMLMVQFNASQNMGVYGILDSSEDFIVEIGMMIEKLNIITSRCGLCDDESLITTC